MYKFSFSLFFLLTIPLLWQSSCKKVTEDVQVVKGLVGEWSIGKSDVTATVNGIDFINYATNNYGLSVDEADDLLDAILDETIEVFSGKIFLRGDKIYEQKLIGQDENIGIWYVSLNGEILTLVFEEEETSVKILSLSNTSLTIEFMENSIEVDMDGDGTKETTVDIQQQQDLTKSVGGAGS